MSFSRESIKKSLIDGYNRHAVYFSSSRNRPWKEIEQIILSLPKRARVLDLGCGNGRLLLSLDKSCHYLGIDFSEQLIEEARRLHPGKRFMVGDFAGESVWDKLGKYEAIFLVASMHHIQKEDQVRVINQCMEHLEDGGVLVITVWNLLAVRMWKYHLGSLALKLQKGMRSVWVPFVRRFDRYHWTFDARSLSKLVDSVGLSVKRCEYLSKGKSRKWHDGENLVLVAYKKPQSL